MSGICWGESNGFFGATAWAVVLLWLFGCWKCFTKFLNIRAGALPRARGRFFHLPYHLSDERVPRIARMTRIRGGASTSPGSPGSNDSRHMGQVLNLLTNTDQY